MKVKFLRDAKWVTAKVNRRPEDPGHDTPWLEAGQEYDLDDTLAQRFITTNDAEPVSGKKAAAAVTKTNGGEPADYDSWTAEDLHKEATKRNLEGRSGLDKAALVKALQKDDKKSQG